MASNIVGLLGSLVCASANATYVVILGQILVGFGCGGQTQAVAIMSEIFPHKHRALVQGEKGSSFSSNLYRIYYARESLTRCWKTTALLYISPLPFVVCSPLIAEAMAAHNAWRWIFYVNIILTTLSLILLTLFYYPVCYPFIALISLSANTTVDCHWWRIG